ncbi:MAG: 3-oxoacyl-ACP synthase [Polyangiaceae bacterium]|nr:3-oxoacyl-ACP synthase [Polyangiaceae bacterium]
MTASAVVAFGAVSALGEGQEALGCVPEGHRAPLAIARDAELLEAKLARPFCARVGAYGHTPLLPAAPDRATVLLERALDACVRDLGEIMPDLSQVRMGLVLGTSSGGMRRFEETFASTADPPPSGWIEGSYLGPVLATHRPCSFARFALVLGACASSTLAVGLGHAWLETGACDVVLAGGFDAVSVFVASGFEVLRATSADGKPDPFRVGRDGLVLGEGAAVMALASANCAADRHLRTYGWVTGFGASCDAIHLTAPDRTGGGLARAAAQALGSCGVVAADVDLVSAHGTATEFNDASEARALATVLGEHRSRVAVHALKGSVGHTLGAAGALESLSALFAMRTGLAPASAGEGTVMDGVRVLDVAEASSAAITLKLSAAFGGANAALVLAKNAVGKSLCTGLERRDRPVYVSRAVAISGDGARGDLVSPSVLAARTGYAEDRILRSDNLVRLTMAAVALLDEALSAREQPRIRGAGIIVGHGLATFDTNAKYLERIRSAGAHRGEPRRFPYTTPNAAAGECAVAFGLNGPAFAVGGGPHGGIEALSVAADLVRTGTADRIIVVAADEAGDLSRHVAPDTVPGAVALMVAATPLAGELVECSVRLEKSDRTGPLPAPSAMDAHRALLPLARVPWHHEAQNEARRAADVAARGPLELSVVTPWGIRAYARFLSLPRVR